MGTRNQIVASGRLTDVDALRYTPAGIPAVEFRLVHESTQKEAGGERKVQCEFNCICLGKQASSLAALAAETEIVVKGFLAAKSQRWKSNLVLHVVDWKMAPIAEPPVI